MGNMERTEVDIKENSVMELDSELLTILLHDKNSGKNIIWATEDYSEYGYGFGKTDEIYVRSITGANGNIIRPRTEKTKKEQQTRIKDKAEVFTPSWVCNKQNNLVDNAWFGRENIFNTEHEKTWITTKGKIEFPSTDGKGWEDYIAANRLEISCGEGPYLASRYDTVTGKAIALKNRIGLLDRKLRVVSENVSSEAEWYKWAKKAIQSVYGYDWQGDNVLLTRENLLYTFIDYYVAKFDVYPIKEYLREIAEILSWNIWQMDGLKFVIPNSCHNETIVEYFLWGEETHEEYCEGCRKNNRNKHNGIYCYIMDWEKNKRVKFVNLIGGRRK
ncbi:MAG: hypothetical protein MRZ86_05945 [Acidaminococcus sp.]|nr:hypothetical protein [Acidaminococcus sp.]